MTAFDPQEWLARFEAIGGGWIVQDGRPVLLCRTGVAACDHCLAELANGRREAVLALVFKRHVARDPVTAEQ